MALRASLLLFLLGLTLTQAAIKIFDLRASDLPSDILGITDGYVKVYCGPSALGQTTVKNNNANPWWEDEFTFFKAEVNMVLRLEVFDKDLAFDDLLGVCQRQVKVGTYRHDCFLEKGGTLHYSYTLSHMKHVV